MLAVGESAFRVGLQSDAEVPEVVQVDASGPRVLLQRPQMLGRVSLSRRDGSVR
jgi:hypothetical protein